MINMNNIDKRYKNHNKKLNFKKKKILQSIKKLNL